LPTEVGAILCEQGLDAVSVVEQSLSGAADELVADVCKSEQRVLVTLDLDFADIRTYPPEEYSGIIVLRPKEQTISMIVVLTKRIVRLLESLSPDGQLWVLDEFHLRIRP
jgi:predicted nuclease of predicted toxin-antitoxin system